METSINEKVPFTREWNILNKISDNLYSVYKKRKNKTEYSLMYIHTFTFVVGRDYKECEKYNLEITNPYELENINEKIKYFRLKSSLYQEEVAKIIGIDRTTYISYENGLRVYPIEVMTKLSNMYNVDLDVLLDDYHRFIYFNQGQNIKKIRKELGLNQDELAELLGVSFNVIKRAEQEKVRFLEKNYIKLQKLYKNSLYCTKNESHNVYNLHKY